MSEGMLNIAIDLAKKGRIVFEHYNSLMLLEKDSLSYRKSLEALKKAVKEEQTAYLEVPNIYKLNEYVIASLEQLQNNPSSILFLRMNDICETIILKKLESHPQESINNFLAKSIETTCLINGLSILEHKIDNLRDIALSIKLERVKYECACYNQLIENILLKNDFEVVPLSYQEPTLFANLIGNINPEFLTKMKIDISKILLKDFTKYLIDNLDNEVKVIEYTSYIEGTLGILSLEERKNYFRQVKPLFKNYASLSFHILTLFNNLDEDLKLIRK